MRNEKLIPGAQEGFVSDTFYKQVWNDTIREIENTTVNRNRGHANKPRIEITKKHNSYVDIKVSTLGYLPLDNLIFIKFMRKINRPDRDYGKDDLILHFSPYDPEEDALDSDK